MGIATRAATIATLSGMRDSAWSNARRLRRAAAIIPHSARWGHSPQRLAADSSASIGGQLKSDRRGAPRTSRIWTIVAPLDNEKRLPRPSGLQEAPLGS